MDGPLQVLHWTVERASLCKNHLKVAIPDSPGTVIRSDTPWKSLRWPRWPNIASTMFASTHFLHWGKDAASSMSIKSSPRTWESKFWETLRSARNFAENCETSPRPAQWPSAYDNQSQRPQSCHGIQGGDIEVSVFYDHDISWIISHSHYISSCVIFSKKKRLKFAQNTAEALLVQHTLGTDWRWQSYAVHDAQQTCQSPRWVGSSQFWAFENNFNITLILFPALSQTEWERVTDVMVQKINHYKYDTVRLPSNFL